MCVQKIHLNCKATSALRAICRFKSWLASVPFYNPNITHACYLSFEFVLQFFLNFCNIIEVGRVKQRHRRNSELLNGSSSSSSTKLDLIYAFETTVYFILERFYIRPTARRKKNQLPRNEKVGNELRRPLRRWKKVKGGHPIFCTTPRLIAIKVRVYFHRNFDLTSPCENIRARLNFWMAYDFSKGRPLYNWMFQVSKSIALLGIKGVAHCLTANSLVKGNKSMLWKYCS